MKCVDSSELPALAGIADGNCDQEELPSPLAGVPFVAVLKQMLTMITHVLITLHIFNHLITDSNRENKSLTYRISWFITMSKELCYRILEAFIYK